MSADFELELLSSGWGLIEGPRVDEHDNFYFSDVPNGGVRRLRPDGEIEIVVPKRRGVGGMVLHADGGVVVSGRNIQHVTDAGSEVLFAPDVAGFNDMHTDSLGRVYVGSLRRNPFDESSPDEAGELYRINLDGSTDEVYGDVQLTNGIGFSPDGTRLYHSDSIPGRVWVSDVDGDVVSNRREFVAERKVPDGLAVDVDGGVWVALAEGGRVQRYTPDGEPDLAVPVPDQFVTSVCFGGADMRDLYIVTGGSTADALGAAGGGCIFRTRAPVAGVPTPLARVRPAS
ncbi:MAG: SMP-30/gluconolactonase/LRE family protein [Acidimicrobiales bacterium]|uniref:SMP-30/gluconolactonase/LRE family protein n=1 Tax=Candidatus Poriferisodalis sp. TaxID=3101277 RepID=UPI001381E262|nr:SMP-30/gluconolactonase/LRE family protein [Acidimicrobiales bacterium]MXZ15464.1 SMP-30/gluconolactonase/LRE family protein [Acidimicrobiales bacterium]MYG60686.1 SMP-30/gluconolactonase/LRE family protein [Acidimicrobiales bacterium]MYI07820.1 SMP-30/gluconolactonase/LRE family protein [Acidimicrobiales bacterium]MYJ47162.1 SMP-30/gluconolactonase/LRE family protein [Acidimicrobiales bacterium]